jgi:hypothetical protein
VHIHPRFHRARGLWAAIPLVALFCGSAAAQDGTITSITLSADAPAFRGPCPARITVTGQVVTDGPIGNFKARFEHADGFRGPAQSQNVDRAGTYTFQEVLDRGAALAGWDLSINLVVLTPGTRGRTQAKSPLQVTGVCTSLTGQSARVTVSAVHIHAVRQTHESAFERYGLGDEVSVRSWACEVRRGDPSAYRTPPVVSHIYGDTYFRVLGPGGLQHPLPRIRAGTASHSTGGIVSGNHIPPGDTFPVGPRQADPLRMLPLQLWQGTLRDGPAANMAVVVPTVWEEDDETLDLGFDEQIRRALSSNVPRFLASLMAPRGGVLDREEFGLRTSAMTGAPQFTRPIGVFWAGPHAPLQAEPYVLRFAPWVLKLTLARAAAAAVNTRASASGRPGEIDLLYVDGEDWVGEYILTIKIAIDTRR